MFEKDLRLSYLMDFYGDVLDEHTQRVMKAYYDDDLSLSEIAEDVGISRQGVRHVIKKAQEQLEFLESRLGLAKERSLLDERIAKLREIHASLLECKDGIAADASRALGEVIDEFKNKN